MVKLVEFALRHVARPDLSMLFQLISWDVASPQLFRSLFNAVSLSPYTSLVDNAIALIELTGRQDVFDVLGDLLIKLGRHLTAYDLVTFHHRGANYPDALLLDAVLKEYLAWAERRPELFADSAGERWRKRLRRRALRQGWLLRRRYQGPAV